MRVGVWKTGTLLATLVGVLGCIRAQPTVPIAEPTSVSEPVSEPIAEPTSEPVPASEPEAGPISAPRVLPGGDACWPANTPKIEALRQLALAEADKSFNAALQKRRLAKTVVPLRTYTLHQGAATATGQRAHPRGQVISNPPGFTGRYIASDTSWSGSPSQPRPWEFVLDAKGTIYRLMRSPLPSARSVEVRLCGCRPQQCGPVGSGCPACGATVQTMYGPLPPGTRYGGEIIVRYEIATVATAFVGTHCPPQPACSYPPSRPPPRR